MSNPKGTKATTNAKILAILLAIYIVSDLLLTPIGGLETRPVADVSTIGIVTLGLLFVGLILAVVSLVLVFRSPRRASLLSMVGAVLYFPAFLIDQAGLFSSLHPPPAIVDVEILQGIIAVLVILVAVGIRTRRVD